MEPAHHYYTIEYGSAIGRDNTIGKINLGVFMPAEGTQNCMKMGGKSPNFSYVGGANRPPISVPSQEKLTDEKIKLKADGTKPALPPYRSLAVHISDDRGMFRSRFISGGFTDFEQIETEY